MNVHECIQFAIIKVNFSTILNSSVIKINAIKHFICGLCKLYIYKKNDCCNIVKTNGNTTT